MYQNTFLGTGNGAMLNALSLEGFTNLTGVDYSSKAIELAIKIAQDQELLITFKVADLLSDQIELGQFKVCHDKGTYDAIALMENARDNRLAYLKNISKLMVDDGFFIITSCNFTEDELISAFKKSQFVKMVTIPTQMFRFGGKTGSVVTSMVFKKHL